MEICGNIFTNSDYSVFLMKCIYCPIEKNVKDWQEFVLHTQYAHRIENADDGSTQSENDIEVVTEPYEAYEEVGSFTDMKVESETGPPDEEYYETEDIFEEAMDTQHSTKSEEQTSPSHYSRKASISNIHGDMNGFECEYEIHEEKHEMSADSDIYEYLEDEGEDEEVSTDTDDEADEVKPPWSRTNPMTIKQKLKVSFDRHNPRVLQLIEEFKKHPCLWNPNDEYFQNESAEAEAYNAIIEGMDKKVNVLFNVLELKKSIQQLLKQFALARQKADESELTVLEGRYLRRCKFLATSNSSDDDDDPKSDVIQLNFKELNEMTTTFIETFAKFPVLYNSCRSDFRSVDARTAAYIKISQLLAPEIRVNETEVYLAVTRLRKWAYMTLRRVKSKELRRSCTKSELHYLQLCSFLPPKPESFVINCEYCNKRFFIDYSLRAHMVKAHNVGELPYACSQCPRRFEKAHDMEKHKLRQHCEKMLKCEYCDRTFSLKGDLRVHIRVHTGEKPFVCELCGKSFRLKLLLDYHINGFHLNLRPYKCELCTNTYRKRVQLKNHMKAHLNIKDKKCVDCGATFTCPTVLSRHRKKFHNNQK